eukprot:SAG11_NODE_2033_length_3899_cov_2.298421_1_plen_86_part_00
MAQHGRQSSVSKHKPVELCTRGVHGSKRALIKNSRFEPRAHVLYLVDAIVAWSRVRHNHGEWGRHIPSAKHQLELASCVRGSADC